MSGDEDSSYMDMRSIERHLVRATDHLYLPCQYSIHDMTEEVIGWLL